MFVQYGLEKVTVENLAQAARLLLPLVWALICSLLVEFIFGLADFFRWQIVVAALLSTIHVGALALMAVAFSQIKLKD